jgi:hypothetical protein
MITEHDVRRNGGSILLGIAVGNAVLDVVSTEGLLQECLNLLETPHRGLVDTRMGTFGAYPVSLNLHHDESVSIFIDGPDFESSRNQSAGIYLEKGELRRLLVEVLQGSKEEAK